MQQLLELGDRIGYVNTGLKESEIRRCLRKINPFLSNTLLADRKCSICQVKVLIVSIHFFLKISERLFVCMIMS